MQVALICGACIEVKAAAKGKGGGVSKAVEATELDADVCRWCGLLCSERYSFMFI